jgi:hypothetical protein
MLGIVAHAEQAAMHLRVQRLHPPVHHLGKAGELGDVAHLQPRLAQRLGGAAGRDQLHPVPRQRLAELGKARLVGNGQERALIGCRSWLRSVAELVELRPEAGSARALEVQPMVMPSAAFRR